MADIGDIYLNIHDAISANVPYDVTVIFANGNSSPPEVPFVTVLISSYSTSGKAIRGEMDEEGGQTVTLRSRVVATVRVFGSTPQESMSIAELINDGFWLLDTRDILGKEIAYSQTIRGPEDVATLVAEEWEPQVLLEVEFITVRDIVDDIGLIEIIEGTGIVENKSINISVSEEEL